LVIVKEDIATYSIVIRPIFELGYSLTALQYAQLARVVKAEHHACSSQFPARPLLAATACSAWGTNKSTAET